MVKIIDGEIVPDDDPRVTQRSNNRGPGTASTSGANDAGQQRHPPGLGGGNGFNFSAPPFRVADPLPGAAPLLGVPDVEIFGLRITPIAAAAIAALGYKFGWRGLLAASVLYYIYKLNAGNAGQQGPQPAGQGHPQQQQHEAPGGGQAAGPADFLQRYFQGRPAPPNQQSGGGQGPQQGQGSNGNGEGGGGAFTGRGYKLGGN